MTPVESRLTFVAEAGRNRHGQKLWRCQCQCGQEITTLASAVRTGHTKSCGCLQKDRPSRLRHGHRRTGGEATRTYVAWCNMKARCDNADGIGYRNYGGRGIRYCDRWACFDAFLADMGECPEGLELERVDVNGHYEPGNCVWTTRKAQCVNKRVNHRVEYQGESLTLSQWAQRLNLTYLTLFSRLKRGWPVERALQPVIYHRHRPEGRRSTSCPSP